MSAQQRKARGPARRRKVTSETNRGTRRFMATRGAELRRDCAHQNVAFDGGDAAYCRDCGERL